MRARAALSTLLFHALRATVAINALDHRANLVKVWEKFERANIVTTPIYDHRRMRAEDSHTSQVTY